MKGAVRDIIEPQRGGNTRDREVVEEEEEEEEEEEDRTRVLRALRQQEVFSFVPIPGASCHKRLRKGGSG